MNLQDNAPEGNSANGGNGAGRQSVTDALVELGLKTDHFIRDQRGETFAVPRAGGIARQMRGGQGSYRQHLRRTFRELHGRSARSADLSDAIAELEALAEGGVVRDVHLRAATEDGVSWVDMGWPEPKFLRIGSNRWGIYGDSPALFRRTQLIMPHPLPVKGADLAELWGFVNVAEPFRPAVLAWLVCAIARPGQPTPIVSFAGEQGCGKTRAATALVNLSDPQAAPTRKPPHGQREWPSTVANTRVIAFDNMSSVPEWLSDSLCRAVTGEADVARALYTDSDIHVIRIKAALIINGIDVGAVRGDLAERFLPIRLERIAKRKSEEQLAADWKEAHPRILGALLDLAVKVLRVLPSIRLDNPPRMVDYARVLAAVDQVLGTDGMSVYLAGDQGMAGEVIAGDPFLQAVADNGAFSGTARDMLSTLHARAVMFEGTHYRAPKGWPATPKAASGALLRGAPVLRKQGWTVTEQERSGRPKVWTLEPPTEVDDIEPVQVSEAGDHAEHAPDESDEWVPPWRASN